MCQARGKHPEVVGRVGSTDRRRIDILVILEYMRLQGTINCVSWAVTEESKPPVGK